MFKIEKDLTDIEQKVVIEFEEDYSDKTEIQQEINEIIEEAFNDWLNFEEVYDEEDQAEVDNMNPARFICERLDDEGYSTVDYSLEDI